MNATLLHRQTRSDVAVTSITRRPRAIVIVLGESLDHHYSELYHSLQCSTISVNTFDKHTEKQMSEWAVSVSRETARLVRMAQLSEMGMGQHVPVMIHVLGDSGTMLVKALEEIATDVPTTTCVSTPPPRSGGKLLFHMNASARSLFTHETDPLSSDDEEDDLSSSHEEDEEDSTLVDALPVMATRPVLARHCSPSTSAWRRYSTQSSPSVHRIDMERTGVTLQHSLNPQEQAHQRDLQTFCSHLSIMLWDVPPTNRNKGWRLSDLLTRVLVFLVLLWNFVRQCLFGAQCTTLTTPRRITGLSLVHQHALAFCDSRDNSVQQLLQESNVVLKCKFQGTRTQHASEYVEFLQQVLERISPSTSDDDDDGFSSDEDEDF